MIFEKLRDHQLSQCWWSLNINSEHLEKDVANPDDMRARMTQASYLDAIRSMKDLSAIYLVTAEQQSCWAITSCVEHTD